MGKKKGQKSEWKEEELDSVALQERTDSDDDGLTSEDGLASKKVSAAPEGETLGQLTQRHKAEQKVGAFW